MQKALQDSEKLNDEKSKAILYLTEQVEELRDKLSSAIDQK